MKYLFVLFAMGFVMAASAQSYDTRPGWQVQVNRYPAYSTTDQRHDEGDRWEDINRMYDRRISDIQNDYALSRHQKRKLTREVNEEREDRLKSLQKYQRKEMREKRREYN